jgi:hypothetical protein
MSGRESIEKRNHKRFSPRSPAFVAVGAPNKKKIAHIVDICMGGLAFDYIADETRFNTRDSLDIYSAEEGFYLKEVLFTTVSDVELPREFPWRTITMRRRGIQFNTLTPDQVSQVKDFLLHHTVGKPKVVQDFQHKRGGRFQNEL